MTADDDFLLAALREHWHLRAVAVTPLPGGWMTRAWGVLAEGEPLIARLVDPTVRHPYEAGLAAAVHLRSRGITIGEPVRTLTGALAAVTPAGAVGVLRRTHGSQLDGADPIDQHWWGDRLAAAHRALDGFRHPGLLRCNRLQPDAAHLDVELWVRPAVAEAVTAATRLTIADRLTYGVLHGDPAPESFVVDGRSGATGLLDWGPCGSGPLVYDLAAAVAYAGGPERAAELIDGYVAAGAVHRDEVEAALPVLLRYRWAVQADFYARRLTSSPACADPADWAGLHAARDCLARP